MPELDDVSRDEFYTGYLPQAPPGIARRVRGAVIALFVVAVAVAAVLVVGQRGFSKAVYEFGTLRDFEGLISEAPYPTLTLVPPGVAGDAASRFTASRFYLVAPGKFGAADAVAGLDGRRVKLRGTLIYRDDQTMIEVVPESIEPAGVETAAPAAGEGSLGVVTLRGRIVDSKCFLGIMKPGATKPHRACATRCIAGGIPPLFVVSDEQGPAAYLMLVGPGGRAVNEEVLDMVDEPLEITGTVSRLDDLWLLEADPASFKRLL